MDFQCEKCLLLTSNISIPLRSASSLPRQCASEGKDSTERRSFSALALPDECPQTWMGRKTLLWFSWKMCHILDFWSEHITVFIVLFVFLAILIYELSQVPSVPFFVLTGWKHSSLEDIWCASSPMVSTEWNPEMAAGSFSSGCRRSRIRNNDSDGFPKS